MSPGEIDSQKSQIMFISFRKMSFSQINYLIFKVDAAAPVLFNIKNQSMEKRCNAKL